jgi:hypothetical protein
MAYPPHRKTLDNSTKKHVAYTKHSPILPGHHSPSHFRVENRTEPVRDGKNIASHHSRSHTPYYLKQAPI